MPAYWRWRFDCDNLWIPSERMCLLVTDLPSNKPVLHERELRNSSVSNPSNVGINGNDMGIMPRDAQVPLFVAVSSFQNPKMIDFGTKNQHFHQNTSQADSSKAYSRSTEQIHVEKPMIVTVKNNIFDCQEPFVGTKTNHQIWYVKRQLAERQNHIRQTKRGFSRRKLKE